jgi:putative iron-only hydrogenase system regulator
LILEVRLFEKEMSILLDEKRLAVVGISVSNREESANKVNKILSDYAGIIVGRMGLPYKEKGISIISIIVDATNEEIGALAGKIGNNENIKVKVVIMS